MHTMTSPSSKRNWYFRDFGPFATARERERERERERWRGKREHGSEERGVARRERERKGLSEHFIHRACLSFSLFLSFTFVAVQDKRIREANAHPDTAHTITITKDIDLRERPPIPNADGTSHAAARVLLRRGEIGDWSLE